MREERGIPCRSYTHARRYPWVVGKIGGWQLPTQLSPTQLLVLVGSFLALLHTRGLWARLPGTLNLVVQMAMPVVLAWSVRHLRMEGRSPLRTLAGYLTLLAQPPRGRARGRPLAEAPARRLRGRVFATEAVADPAGPLPPP